MAQDSHLRRKRIRAIAVVFAIVIVVVVAVLLLRNSAPIFVDISKKTQSDHGVETAGVRFRSSNKQGYVGFFYTEVFADGHWIKSASQHREAGMAMAIWPKEEIYQMPVPREGMLWRVHWSGSLFGNDPAYRFKEKLAGILKKPFFRNTLHIRYSPNFVLEAYAYSTNRVDF